MSRLRVIFMGTPAFAVPSLEALVAADHDIAAVYTQPPRPTGRGYKVTPSPVHAFADALGLTVLHPESLKPQEEKDAFAALGADVAVVVAFGLILPKAVLAAPRLGCLNLHGSLLPRWRGAAPIQRAIMAGDPVTGVQVMQMEAGLDTGPILLSETVPITESDTAGTLSERLAPIGASLLPRALAALDRGSLVATPQPEDGITYAHKITSEEAKIDWSWPGAKIDAHIRGLNPVPGAWTIYGDQEPVRLKVWETAGLASIDGAPGTVMAHEDEAIIVATGDAASLRIKTLQRPGKARQSASDFLRGFDLSVGSRLG